MYYTSAQSDEHLYTCVGTMTFLKNDVYATASSLYQFQSHTCFAPPVAYGLKEAVIRFCTTQSSMLTTTIYKNDRAYTVCNLDLALIPRGVAGKSTGIVAMLAQAWNFFQPQDRVVLRELQTMLSGAPFLNPVVIGYFGVTDNTAIDDDTLRTRPYRDAWVETHPPFIENVRVNTFEHSATETWNRMDPSPNKVGETLWLTGGVTDTVRHRTSRCLLYGAETTCTDFTLIHSHVFTRHLPLCVTLKRAPYPQPGVLP
jgi:hypothetical protein